MENYSAEEKTLFHKKSGSNKTGFLGVKFNQRNNRFEAFIRVKDKKVYCGSSKVKEEAARMYDHRAVEMFGKNAITNFEQEC